MPLHQVYPSDTAVRTIIDIVAVHGLDPGDVDNHAFETWTKNGRLWLKDDFPSDFPLARVFIYQYQSHPPHFEIKKRLVEEALQLLNLIDSHRDDDEPGQPPRPLVFVAHGLGGLLVKHCMIKANLDQNLSHLFRAVRGLVFFGVPHRGGKEKLLLMGKVAKSIIDNDPDHAPVSDKEESDFLDAITGGSPTLDTLTEQFRGLLGHCSIVSFYESKPYSSFGIVVTESSAKIGLHNEFIIRLEADHLDVCRFDITRDEQDRESYRLVRKRMYKLYKDAFDDSMVAGEGQQKMSQQMPAEPRNAGLRAILALPGVPDAGEMDQLLRGVSGRMFEA